MVRPLGLLVLQGGSFGVTLLVYKKAVEAIQTMPLSLLMDDLGNTSHEFLYIFSRYQSLSDKGLTTLGSLFRFIIDLMSRLPEECHFNCYNEGALLETSCWWSSKRVDLAIRVILEVLRKAVFRWVSRQEVRDAARVYIGDTGLLEFVLKSLGNHMLGRFLVRRSLNPVTKVLEYCLKDMSKESNPNNPIMIRTRSTVTRIHILKDFFYLYGYLFKEQYARANRSINGTLTIAASIFPDVKHLVKVSNKEIPSKVDIMYGAKLTIFCTVQLRDLPSNRCRPMNGSY